MELHSLKPAAGSIKKRKRIARGQGSGKGGTATRGHKGAKSRSGYKSKRGFEGGQMPLQMRLPKRGFKSPNRVEYATLNVDQLEFFAEKYNTTTLDLATLIEHGIVGKNDKVKILARGEVQQALNVTAHAFSSAAKEAIENKGGTATEA
ncbi:MAG: 50S ribosomal protein L15 [Saprospiraceae bacterium]|nr:50S ribosomal protein L15 [Saprospiraceae bacterium]